MDYERIQLVTEHLNESKHHTRYRGHPCCARCIDGRLGLYIFLKSCYIAHHDLAIKQVMIARIIRRSDFGCLYFSGNITLPTAEVVFRKMVADRNLNEHFAIDSAGTAGYHVGAKPDERSVEVAVQWV